MSAESLIAFRLAAASSEELQRVCGTEPGWACREALDATGSEFLADLAGWAIGAPLRIVLILAIAAIAARVAGRAIEAMLRRLTSLSLSRRLEAARELAPIALVDAEEASQRSGQRLDALVAVLRSATAMLIWAIALLLILAELGVSLAPLLAGAGVVGLAIGFGAQSLVKDFFAGLFILIEDQFAVGDIVDLGEADGVVESVSLRTTRLRGLDGTVWHIPNGEIVRVGNMSQHWSRSLLDVEVAYDSDLGAAQKLIKRVADEVAAEDEDVIDEPEVWGVEALGESSIVIRLVVKTRPSEQWRISRTLRERIKTELDDAGIEIPFPQHSVWLRGKDSESRPAAGG